MLGELEEILEPADGLDLGEVDHGLDGLALAEVEAKRGSVVGAVLVGEPEAEQSARGQGCACVSLRAPRIDARSDAIDGVSPFAGLAPRRDAVRVKDVDDLDHDRVAARLRVLVPVALRDERRRLARPVGLPLVVEDLVAVVEVDGPVVDEIGPRLDPVADLGRDQLLLGIAKSLRTTHASWLWRRTSRST